MGNIQIGVLLGSYGGGQSFDVASTALTSSVGSWSISSPQTSADLVTTVHSSQQALSVRVFSEADAAFLAYDYGYHGDAYSRWSPDVTTHNILVRAWGRLDTAAHSGQVNISIVTAADSVVVPVPEASGYQLLSAATVNVYSDANAGPTIQFNRAASFADSARLYLDDVLTAIDVLDLDPGWQTYDGTDQLTTRHTTLSGFERLYQWHRKSRWSLPLRHVPSSAADLINRWWYHGWNLYFTMDSSDSAETQVVRLVNEGTPFVSVSLPYWDRHEGTLELVQVTRGLGF